MPALLTSWSLAEPQSWGVCTHISVKAANTLNSSTRKNLLLLSSWNCVWGENGQIQAVREEKRGSNGKVQCQRGGEGMSQYWRDYQNDKGTTDKMTRGRGMSDCAIKQLTLHLIQAWTSRGVWFGFLESTGFDHLAVSDTEMSLLHSFQGQAGEQEGSGGSHVTLGCFLWDDFLWDAGLGSSARFQQQMQDWEGGSALREVCGKGWIIPCPGKQGTAQGNRGCNSHFQIGFRCCHRFVLWNSEFPVTATEGTSDRANHKHCKP